MKRITSLFLVITAILFTGQLAAQENQAIEKGLEAITMESLKAPVKFMSTDFMEGRAAGERGAYMAADYIASVFEMYGAAPAGDMEWTQVSREERWNGKRSEEYQTYFQNFNLVARNREEMEAELLIRMKTKESLQEIKLQNKVDFVVGAGNLSTAVEAPLVFVGYGYVNEEHGYDDFKGVDVEDKIIVRLPGYPGHLDTSSVGYANFHSDQRYFEYYLENAKNEAAREKGALAIIELREELTDAKALAVNDQLWSNSEAEQPRAPIYSKPLSLPHSEISIDLAEILLSHAAFRLLLPDVAIEQFERNVANTLKPASREIKDVAVSYRYEISSEMVRARNVLAVIEGEIKDEIIVIGGHYDHLGAADGFVWNGADDNASGTVGVMTLAKAFMATGIKPKRTIVFAAWTAEERGLWGSRYFVEHPYGDDISKVVLNINLDMISKNSMNDSLGNNAGLVYTAANSMLEELSEKHIAAEGLNLIMRYRPSESPSGGSDHAPFAQKGIPVMFHMGGFPVTYHTPKDGHDDINWEKYRDIVKLVFLNAWHMANEDDWL